MATVTQPAPAPFATTVDQTLNRVPDGTTYTNNTPRTMLVTVYVTTIAGPDNLFAKTGPVTANGTTSYGSGGGGESTIVFTVPPGYKYLVDTIDVSSTPTLIGWFEAT